MSAPETVRGIFRAPMGLPCTRCAQTVLAGTLTVWAGSDPLCRRCVREIGLIDLVDLVDASEALDRAIASGRVPVAFAAAVERFRVIGLRWAHDELDERLRVNGRKRPWPPLPRDHDPRRTAVP